MVSNTSAARRDAPARVNTPQSNPRPSQGAQPSQPQTAQVPGRRDEFQAARPTGGSGVDQIGSLSRKHESNGNPGLVSSGRGDHGGRSYGAYQFSSNTGSAAEFTGWLSRTNPDMARDIAGKRPNTPAFDAGWKQTARRDPSGFLSAQHDFIKQKFYDPAAARVKQSTGLDVSKRSGALRDVLWSTAVQHGQGGANSVFKTALGGRDPNTVSDTQLIDAVYAERGRKNAAGGLVHFRSSAPDWQHNIANRFQQERREAQAMLTREQQGGGTPAPTAPGGTNPAPTAPGGTNPAPTAPGGTNPAPTAPGGTNPAPTAPGGTNPAPTAPGGANPAPQAPLFKDSLLARGDRSQDVRNLQQMLRQNGINTGQVDGIFGPKTQRAVREFQSRQGLKTDGLVGDQTSAALGKASGGGGGTTPTRPTTPAPTTPAPTKPTTPANPTGPTAPTNPAPQGPGGGQNGVAQIQKTQNAGARNQMVTGQITVNGNTYQFRSGGHGRGSLPTGQYTVTPHLNSRSEPGFSVGGVGFSFAVSDKFDPRVGGTRSLLRIHPDGGSVGTNGCIGIVGNADTMRRFRDDMNAELKRNGGRYALTVR